MTLTQTQLEVLSRGPNFGIPPRAICKEEVLSEFEMYFTQVERALLDSEIPTSGYAEQLVRFRTRLTDLAQRYTSVKLDHTAFPLGRDHLRAIHELRRESDVVICRPDKGTGIVLLDRADYNSKMMEILNDTSKFECLGSCEEHDRTEQIEKALQAFLLRQQKAGKIGEAIYNRIRPCGSVRPRMYGLPKIHKPEPIPLRPILSMVGSAHHELARWLTEILQPVLEHYSEHVIADSFEFCKVLHGDVELGGNAFMCSFDVTSLFTNVPIIETIQICLDALYRCDGIEAPNIDEGLLRKLLLKCTRDVEFSFNGLMFRQTDGVAMGSPLGPVLANVFLGHCEKLIPKDDWPSLYRRYVDDTFSLFLDGKEKAVQFLAVLNGLHPSLRFTMEAECDKKLPFLDVHVTRELRGFSTTVYRKPTFTALYTRWDSYCATSKKIALIQSLTVRAKRICSPEHLDEEIASLKSIFARNGYPQPIVDRVIGKTLQPQIPVIGVEFRPCYIRLPWVGQASLSFHKQIDGVTKSVAPWCSLVCSFTSRNAFATARKDVLSMENVSNVVYLFNCDCGHSYIGRTSMRLGERMRQHVPKSLEQVGSTAPMSRRGRPRQTCRSPDTNSIASRTRSRTSMEQCGASCNAITAPNASGKGIKADYGKTDTAITRHLRETSTCRRGVCSDVKSHFSILHRARNADHLRTLEALYIARRKPSLCVQKEHVRKLCLSMNLV